MKKCNNLSNAIERKSTAYSATIVGERLDLERVLQRAKQGIFDLNVLRVPGMQFEGDAYSLLDNGEMPAPTFGESYESAQARLRSMAERHPVKPAAAAAEPQPGEAAPSSEPSAEE